jgi:lysophospholipase L1-like esterase
MIRTLAIFLVLFCSTAIFAQDQEAPFYQDIQAFKKLDSINPPPKHAILLIGSSSFTNWKDVAAYFPGYKLINRGFGGSSLPDVIRYADDIIYPYEPRQVLIYCGENDFAGSDTLSVPVVQERFEQLFNLIRSRFENADILYISMKPSPSRRYLFQKMQEANAGIKAFLSKQPNTVYIDVYNKMLASDGQPIKEIFLSDSLHMNAKGYAIWKKQIQPYLKK